MPWRKDNWTRLSSFFGHYDLRVYLTDMAFLDIGRGSFMCADKFGPISPQFSGSVGTIGQFCEAAWNVLFLIHGEHRNDLPVNVTFGGAKRVRAAFEREDVHVRPLRPVEVGNGVVISNGVTILLDRKIGDGAVIGAGAVVTADIPPYSIAAGVPARVKKKRFEAALERAVEEVRWWDFDTSYLIENADRIQELAVDTGTKHRYRRPTPKFVMSLRRKGLSPESDISIIGITDGDRIIPIEAAPPRIQEYIRVALGDEPFDPVTDLWER